MEQKHLISHSISPDALDGITAQYRQKIIAEGDKPYCTTQRQLEIIDELTQFDFGRYLLQHKGINGYWTHYMLTHPWFNRKAQTNNRGEALTPLENFLLNRAPAMLATQERFDIFLGENQKMVQENTTLSSIPCGMMGELLYLDYKSIQKIKLVGIDYDPEALHNAALLAEEKGLSAFTTFIEKDAWHLDIENEFDLISSSGLSIYEPDDNKIVALYREFYRALKHKGKLVTSFLTPPPALTDQCEWDMSLLDQDALLLQRIIFVDIIDAKFQCYRSSEQTKKQLEMAGFRDINFVYDNAKLFPTVVAWK